MTSNWHGKKFNKDAFDFWKQTGTLQLQIINFNILKLIKNKNIVIANVLDRSQEVNHFIFLRKHGILEIIVLKKLPSI